MEKYFVSRTSSELTGSLSTAHSSPVFVRSAGSFLEQRLVIEPGELSEYYLITDFASKRTFY